MEAAMFGILAAIIALAAALGIGVDAGKLANDGDLKFDHY